MGDDDVLVFHTFNQRGKFIDVHVSAGVCAFCVFIHKKRTLGDEDFTLCDVIELRKVNILRVAEVCGDGYLDGIVDSDTFFLQLDKLRSRKVVILGFQFFSGFNDGKADGTFAVFCREDSCDEIGFYLVLVAGFDRDDLCGDSVTIESAPGVDYLFY